MSAKNKRFTCECGKTIGLRYKESHQQTDEHFIRVSPIGARVKRGQSTFQIIWEDDEFYWYYSADGMECGEPKEQVWKWGKICK